MGITLGKVLFFGGIGFIVLAFTLLVVFGIAKVAGQRRLDALLDEDYKQK